MTQARTPELTAARASSPSSAHAGHPVSGATTSSHMPPSHLLRPAGGAVGAALALRGSGRVAVAVLGDGDFVMGASALWTAAHYRIPLLIVIANNLSYYNDETHQETVARQRGRPPENKWIGQRLDDPAVDLPAMARSLGAASPDPVSDPAALAEALEAGFAAAEAGGLHVIDVRVRPGYVSAMPATMDDD